MQKKLMNRLVQQTHGSKLSPGTAAYNKIVDKLTESGMDHTVGDKVTVKFTLATIDLHEWHTVDPVTSVNASHVREQYVILSRLNDKMNLFVFVARDGRKKKVHVIQAEPAMCEQINEVLSRTVAAVEKERTDTMTRKGSVAGLEDDSVGDGNNITFGIGLHEESDLKVEGNPRLMRKNTVNLGGTKGNGAKRRSSTYGQSFASIAPTTIASSMPVVDDGDDLDGLDDLDDLDVNTASLGSAKSDMTRQLSSELEAMMEAVPYVAQHFVRVRVPPHPPTPPPPFRYVWVRRHPCPATTPAANLL